MDVYHVRIGGKAACLRGTDGLRLLDAAQARGVSLICTGPKAKCDAAAALYQEFHPEWGTIEVVAGFCDAPYDPPPGDDMVTVSRVASEAMIDAPRTLLMYAETPGRSLEGMREFLDNCGTDYSYFPEWAKTGTGHLSKAGLAILVWTMMVHTGSRATD